MVTSTPSTARVAGEDAWKAAEFQRREQERVRDEARRHQEQLLRDREEQRVRDEARRHQEQLLRDREEMRRKDEELRRERERQEESLRQLALREAERAKEVESERLRQVQLREQLQRERQLEARRVRRQYKEEQRLYDERHRHEVEQRRQERAKELVLLQQQRQQERQLELMLFEQQKQREQEARIQIEMEMQMQKEREREASRSRPSIRDPPSNPEPKLKSDSYTHTYYSSNAECLAPRNYYSEEHSKSAASNFHYKNYNSWKQHTEPSSAPFHFALKKDRTPVNSIPSPWPTSTPAEREERRELEKKQDAARVVAFTCKQCNEFCINDYIFQKHMKKHGSKTPSAEGCFSHSPAVPPSRTEHQQCEREEEARRRASLTCATCGEFCINEFIFRKHLKKHERLEHQLKKERGNPNVITTYRAGSRITPDNEFSCLLHSMRNNTYEEYKKNPWIWAIKNGKMLQYVRQLIQNGKMDSDEQNHTFESSLEGADRPEERQQVQQQGPPIQLVSLSQKKSSHCPSVSIETMQASGKAGRVPTQTGEEANTASQSVHNASSSSVLEDSGKKQQDLEAGRPPGCKCREWRVKLGTCGVCKEAKVAARKAAREKKNAGKPPGPGRRVRLPTPPGCICQKWHMKKGKCKVCKKAAADRSAERRKEAADQDQEQKQQDLEQDVHEVDTTTGPEPVPDRCSCKRKKGLGTCAFCTAARATASEASTPEEPHLESNRRVTRSAAVKKPAKEMEHATAADPDLRTDKASNKQRECEVVPGGPEKEDLLLKMDVSVFLEKLQALTNRGMVKLVKEKFNLKLDLSCSSESAEENFEGTESNVNGRTPYCSGDSEQEAHTVKRADTSLRADVAAVPEGSPVTFPHISPFSASGSEGTSSQAPASSSVVDEKSGNVDPASSGSSDGAVVSQESPLVFPQISPFSASDSEGPTVQPSKEPNIEANDDKVIPQCDVPALPGEGPIAATSKAPSVGRDSNVTPADSPSKVTVMSDSDAPETVSDRGQAGTDRGQAGSPQQFDVLPKEYELRNGKGRELPRPVPGPVRVHQYIGPVTTLSEKTIKAVYSSETTSVSHFRGQRGKRPGEMSEIQEGPYKGTKLINTPLDGNCMYHAFAYQLSDREIRDATRQLAYELHHHDGWAFFGPDFVTATGEPYNNLKQLVKDLDLPYSATSQQKARVIRTQGMVYVVMNWERYHLGAQGVPLQKTDDFGTRVEIDEPINDAKTYATFIMEEGVYGNELEFGALTTLYRKMVIRLQMYRERGRNAWHYVTSNEMYPGQPLRFYYDEWIKHFVVLHELKPQVIQKKQLFIDTILDGRYRGMQLSVPSLDSSSLFEAILMSITPEQFQQVQTNVAIKAGDCWDQHKSHFRSANGLRFTKKEEMQEEALNLNMVSALRFMVSATAIMNWDKYADAGPEIPLEEYSKEMFLSLAEPGIREVNVLADLFDSVVFVVVYRLRETWCVPGRGARHHLLINNEDQLYADRRCITIAWSTETRCFRGGNVRAVVRAPLVELQPEVRSPDPEGIIRRFKDVNIICEPKMRRRTLADAADKDSLLTSSQSQDDQEQQYEEPQSPDRPLHDKIMRYFGPACNVHDLNVTTVFAEPDLTRLPIGGPVVDRPLPGEAYMVGNGPFRASTVIRSSNDGNCLFEAMSMLLSDEEVSKAVQQVIHELLECEQWHMCQADIYAANNRPYASLEDLQAQLLAPMQGPGKAKVLRLLCSVYVGMHWECFADDIRGHSYLISEEGRPMLKDPSLRDAAAYTAFIANDQQHADEIELKALCVLLRKRAFVLKDRRSHFSTVDGNADMPGKPLMLYYSEDDRQFDVLKDIVPRPYPANKLTVKEVVTGPYKGMQATFPSNEGSSFFEALALLLTDKTRDNLQEKIIESVVQKWDDLKYLIRSSNGLLFPTMTDFMLEAGADCPVAVLRCLLGCHGILNWSKFKEPGDTEDEAEKGKRDFAEVIFLSSTLVTPREIAMAADMLGFVFFIVFYQQEVVYRIAESDTGPQILLDCFAENDGLHQVTMAMHSESSDVIGSVGLVLKPPKVVPAAKNRLFTETGEYVLPEGTMPTLRDVEIESDLSDSNHADSQSSVPVVYDDDGDDEEEIEDEPFDVDEEVADSNEESDVASPEWRMPFSDPLHPKHHPLPETLPPLQEPIVIEDYVSHGGFDVPVRRRPYHFRQLPVDITRRATYTFPVGYQPTYFWAASFQNEGYDHQLKINFGEMSVECHHCGALFWQAETCVGAGDYNAGNPRVICCREGLYIPPRECELQQPDDPIWHLFTGRDEVALNFQRNISVYNDLFALAHPRVERRFQTVNETLKLMYYCGKLGFVGDTTPLGERNQLHPHKNPERLTSGNIYSFPIDEAVQARMALADNSQYLLPDTLTMLENYLREKNAYVKEVVFAHELWNARREEAINAGKPDDDVEVVVVFNPKRKSNYRGVDPRWREDPVIQENRIDADSGNNQVHVGYYTAINPNLGYDFYTTIKKKDQAVHKSVNINHLRPLRDLLTFPLFHLHGERPYYSVKKEVPPENGAVDPAPDMPEVAGEQPHEAEDEQEDDAEGQAEVAERGQHEVSDERPQLADEPSQNAAGEVGADAGEPDMEQNPPEPEEVAAWYDDEDLPDAQDQAGFFDDTVYDYDSLNRIYANRIMIRKKPSVLHYGRRLFREYLMASWMRVEDGRLTFVQKLNQETTIQCRETIIERMQAIGAELQLPAGYAVTLGPSFMNSWRHMQFTKLNSYALMRDSGKPTYMITMTFNHSTPELKEELEREGMRAGDIFDRPDLISRSFQVRVDRLMDDLINMQILGRVKDFVAVMENQKNTNPHVHILLWMHPADVPSFPSAVDSVISAELPNDPVLQQEVIKYNIHEYCCDVKGAKCHKKDGTCRAGFPFKFQETTHMTRKGVFPRRRQGVQMYDEKRKRVISNRWVKPYNAKILQRHGSHHIQIVTNSGAVDYLFPYLTKEKGIDKGKKISMTEFAKQQSLKKGKVVWNEIEYYKQTRIIEPNIALRRILSDAQFLWCIKISRSLELLCVHLEGKDWRRVHGHEYADMHEELAKQSQLERFFELVASDPVQYRDLLYRDVVKFHKWEGNEWRRTVGRRYHVGMLQPVRPTPQSMPRYALHQLLNHVPGPVNRQALRFFNGVQYETDLDAAIARGLVVTEESALIALQEIVTLGTPKMRRIAFALMLGKNHPNNPHVLWDQYKHRLVDCEDLRDGARAPFRAVARARRHIWSILKPMRYWHPRFRPPPDEEIEVSAPWDPNWRPTPLPNGQRRFELLNDRQRVAFEDIMKALRNKDEPRRLFYLSGHGGTGKTFLIHAVAEAMFHENMSFVCSAYSATGALELPNATTACTALGIPPKRVIEREPSWVMPMEDPRYKRIQDASMLCIDEVSMLKGWQLDVVDRMGRAMMMDYTVPFGNKVVILSGDFHQVLPIVKTDEGDVASNCIFRSPTWNAFTQYNFVVNQRAANDPEFAEWLDAISNGSNTTEQNIMLIPQRIGSRRRGREIKQCKTLQELIETVFENDFSSGTSAIVCPTNRNCDEVDRLVIEQMPGETVYRLSHSFFDGGGDFDRAQANNDDDDDDDEHRMPDVVAEELFASGLPPHELLCKEGAVYLVPDNVSLNLGLVNGTKVRMEHVGLHAVVVKVLSGKMEGESLILPRIKLIDDEVVKPKNLNRIQFPIRPAYGWTCHRVQAKSLQRTGVYLPQPVFAHGMFYAAVSRATSLDKLAFFVKDGPSEGKWSKREAKKTTTPGVLVLNIVDRELLREATTTAPLKWATNDELNPLANVPRKVGGQAPKTWLLPPDLQRPDREGESELTAERGRSRTGARRGRGRGRIGANQRGSYTSDSESSSCSSDEGKATWSGHPKDWHPHRNRNGGRVRGGRAKGVRGRGQGTSNGREGIMSGHSSSSNEEPSPAPELRGRGRGRRGRRAHVTRDRNSESHVDADNSGTSTNMNDVPSEDVVASAKNEQPRGCSRGGRPAKTGRRGRPRGRGRM